MARLHATVTLTGRMGQPPDSNRCLRSPTRTLESVTRPSYRTDRNPRDTHGPGTWSIRNHHFPRGDARKSALGHSIGLFHATCMNPVLRWICRRGRSPDIIIIERRKYPHTRGASCCSIRCQPAAWPNWQRSGAQPRRRQRTRELTAKVRQVSSSSVSMYVPWEAFGFRDGIKQSCSRYRESRITAQM